MDNDRGGEFVHINESVNWNSRTLVLISKSVDEIRENKMVV